MEWMLRAVGAFYIVGGAWTLRQLWLSWRMERQFAGALSIPFVERAADAAVGVGAALSLMSGLMLFTMSSAAPVTFLAAWSVQAIYLLWSRQRTLMAVAVPAWGHRQAVHAFAIYTLVTFAVMVLGAMEFFAAARLV